MTRIEISPPPPVPHQGPNNEGQSCLQLSKQGIARQLTCLMLLDRLIVQASLGMIRRSWCSDIKSVVLLVDPAR
jgi:hypothetical protein